MFHFSNKMAKFFLPSSVLSNFSDEKTKRQIGKVKKVIFRQDRGRSYATWISGNIHGMLKLSDLKVSASDFLMIWF